MSKFEGFAVETLGGLADHTYVKVGNTLYGCWGRDEGGRMICKGNGNANKAAKFANWHSLDGKAGIIYGVTGVCHQTANRILRPANIIVREAKGYMASFLTYGTYGTSSTVSATEWGVRKMHCLDTLNPFALMKSSEEQKLFTKIKNNEIALEEATTQSHIIKFRRELAEIHKEEIILSEEQELKLVKLQSTLHDERDTLIKGMKLMSNSDEFAQRTNDAINYSLKETGSYLNRDEYKKVYGTEVGEEIILVDPEIMKKSFYKG